MEDKMTGMSPYEQIMVAEKAGKHAGGVAITGLVFGGAALAGLIAVGIMAPVYANAKAKAVKDVASAQNASTAALLNQMAQLLNTERAERRADTVTLNQTITDTVSGQQASTLTAQQAAELSSIQSVQQNLLNQAIMGNLSENPQKVQIYSAPQPCGCPGCGCGQ